jgi:hypothetical protein
LLRHVLLMLRQLLALLLALLLQGLPRQNSLLPA